MQTSKSALESPALQGKISVISEAATTATVYNRSLGGWVVSASKYVIRGRFILFVVNKISLPTICWGPQTTMVWSILDISCFLRNV